ncbi:MAG: 1-(5-phosphoribosyl)-5-[(5-phosphoribosylamino)methylideneamino]imidazole-4-carboxamide isomerase [Verrucomicrobia bacterium]|nr:MAG: 1-(5-phosphoribosyl)-5-[(5-phosphoribosylamino)methylideneamino]imidazole-4-carboxamide isomerase [Verrucomicrobiota bacterium]
MGKFTIFPAIDLKGGRCVRLRQGRADDATVYSDDPASTALHWKKLGAEWLHVVDLDGAFQGQSAHRAIIQQIAAVGVPIEVGGGLRNKEDIEATLACGARRTIIGTLAWQDPHRLEYLIEIFAGRLVLGIDARDGRVQIKGWTETTEVQAVDLARRADAFNIRTIIYTDTATDGMLQGPNLTAIKKLCRAVACDVIASGGVSSVEDIRNLRALECPNLVGAIVGKAIYENRVTLPALLEAAR